MVWYLSKAISHLRMNYHENHPRYLRVTAAVMRMEMMLAQLAEKDGF